MENKEVMEYKNIKLKVRESFENEKMFYRVAEGFFGIDFYLGTDLIEFKRLKIFNIYDVYVNDKIKGVFIEGEGFGNVLKEDGFFEGIQEIFVVNGKPDDDNCLEGIYRFMNDWKDRKVEVFGKIGKNELNFKEDEIKKEANFYYDLMNKEVRKKAEEWFEKLRTFGIKEGGTKGFAPSIIREYLKKDIDIEVNEGAIKGIVERNNSFKDFEKSLMNENKEGIPLNYNDTLDFFEEIDEKVEARKQKKTSTDVKNKIETLDDVTNYKQLPLLDLIYQITSGLDDDKRYTELANVIGTLLVHVYKGGVSYKEMIEVVEMLSESSNPRVTKDEYSRILKVIIGKVYEI